MFKNYFDKSFELRYFEMNEFGVASPTTVLTLLEETAAEHCHSIDHSLYQLADKKIGWVLVSGIMQMERYPRYKEKITIRTWLSKYSNIKGFRENVIYDAENNIIGRAKGLWIFFDIERRRPTQIFEEIKEKWSESNNVSIDADISKKFESIDIADYQLSFKVSRYDTDMIRHVNNIRYLQWVIESIPDEIMNNYYLHSIDGRFVSEAHYGDNIISLTKELEKTTSEKNGIKYYSHTIKTNSAKKVCAMANSIWKKK
ncbi:acyl-[acyl-carrier-protein] thioesterase [Flagellimonas sp.]|uniref:acyl-[acyl-carrier-protein] thioesterase n=1 Tax=Flagellimonas sp. TaxID=2058762 RepID=UPI003C7ABC2C